MNELRIIIFRSLNLHQKPTHPRDKEQETQSIYGDFLPKIENRNYIIGTK